MPNQALILRQLIVQGNPSAEPPDSRTAADKLKKKR